MNSKIFAYKCHDYDLEKVKEILSKILTKSNFLNSLIPGKKVLLKPNLLMAKDPDSAVTTHPIIIKALVDILEKKNMKIIIADSPGGPFNSKYLKNIYKSCKIEEAVKGSSAELNYDTGYRKVYLSNAKTLKSFEIINAALDSDYIISVAKLKTHGMMTYTGAVKNLYGLIPGLTKANHHFKLKEKNKFAQHIVDLCDYISPAFSIIDGIVGMEGNGPSGGTKINSGILMGARSAFELDHYASSLIGMSSDMVPTVKDSLNRNLIGNYEIITDIENDYIKSYKLPESNDLTFIPKWIPRNFKKIIIENLKFRPIFNHPKCIKCAKCKKICPAKIIEMNNNGYPIYNKEKCISCFCCHEICPHYAIEIKKPLLARLLKS